MMKSAVDVSAPLNRSLDNDEAYCQVSAERAQLLKSTAVLAHSAEVPRFKIRVEGAYLSVADQEAKYLATYLRVLDEDRKAVGGLWYVVVRGIAESIWLQAFHSGRITQKEMNKLWR